VELLPDLRRIHDSGRHLLNLINDVLDLSKIAAGKVDLFPETFEVKPKLLDIVSTVRPLVEKNANTLTVHCPDNIGTMHTDFTRLKQCLLNLLSNAGKFTERGRITLQVRRETTDGQDWVLFDVIDTGIGLEPNQVKKIFRPFVQADSSTTRRFGGTGLGLTVSLSFCQLMGGTILVESAPGKGSTFTLKVPAVYRKPTQQPARPLDVEPSTAFPRSVATPADGRPKILVVDDDQSVQDMLGRLLNKEGYEVIPVTRGEDVLALARQLRPAAITLDVMMPGMDGWSVLSALKADPELADIPVIMLTIVDDKNLGYALGAVDYLVKPVDHNRILSILRTHCQTGPHAGRSALVVEDDPGTREMLRRTLEGDGWTVAEAGNGREALERVAAQKPALIVLDLMMPEMDGFEFLEELRQKPDWQAIPVVVVTARDLSAEDRMFLTGAMFLGGCVKRVLQKGTYRREELLQEARALVTAQSGRASKNE
jgi:CheY-like chemotaxis protein